MHVWNKNVQWNRLRISKVDTMLQETLIFYRIIRSELPRYLFHIIPGNNHQYNTREIDDAATFYCRTDVIFHQP